MVNNSIYHAHFLLKDVLSKQLLPTRSWAWKCPVLWHTESLIDTEDMNHSPGTGSTKTTVHSWLPPIMLGTEMAPDRRSFKVLFFCICQPTSLALACNFTAWGICANSKEQNHTWVANAAEQAEHRSKPHKHARQDKCVLVWIHASLREHTRAREELI